jgi:hypothetical protein
MHRETKDCLRSWADELSSRCNRVRSLIGDAHWLSDGHHKEAILRDFLVRHLAGSLKIERGFVCPASAHDSVSPEVDILISDPTIEMPWFAESQIIIVPPPAVLAHISVKTRVKSQQLKDALQGVAKTYESCSAEVESSKIWSAIFFFDSGILGRDANDRARFFENSLSNFVKLGFDRSDLPNCIAVLNGPVVLINKTSGKEVGVRVFETDRLQLSIMLNDLYMHLQRGAVRRNSLEKVFQQEEYTPIKFKI